MPCCTQLMIQAIESPRSWMIQAIDDAHPLG